MMGVLATMLIGLAALSACALPPTPTQVEVVGSQVWIEWENQTEETYAITMLAGGAATPAWGEVGACSANGIGFNVDEPFTIGLRHSSDRPDNPGRFVADETDWREADGRLLVVITDDGEVTLDTWTKQRVGIGDFCS